MSLLARVRAYPAHPDPVTAACNRIALLVASSQPTYPLYVWALVGGDWWVTFWTFLSTPFFASVPAVARRNPIAGRALLPLTGIANGILSTKAFGVVSGVEAFLAPCVFIAALALRERPRLMWGLVVLTVAAAGLHNFYGAPLGQFTAKEYTAFRHLNFYSVAVLTVCILWMLIPARKASARPGTPPSPPRR